jgi:UDP-glucose-4-epimerase GalE
LRVLVTGGAGYIGSHACKALALAGHMPIAYDNLRTGHRWAVKWGPFEYGDITDGPRLSEVLNRTRPDAVMHFAALAYVDESVGRPDLYYRINIGGTITLLEAMRAHQIDRLVFSSTCTTYGNAGSEPIAETSDQRPVSPYGRSKLMAEQVIRDYACAFPPLSAIALRYFNAAGADTEGEIGEEHDPEPHLLPLVLHTAMGLRPSIEIYGDDYETPDGTCVRDYVHVVDLARAHVAALERDEMRGFAAYNLGAGRGVSVRALIDAARRVTGRSIKSQIGPRRAGDPAILVADTGLAQAELGWAPQLSSLEAMIESAWLWLSEHRARIAQPLPSAKP